MKLKPNALMPVLLFALAGVGTSRVSQAAPADKGIDEVEVVRVTATVEAVDLDKRKVTLLLDNGKKKTYKVDQQVRNLDQVKVGDHLKMSYTEELVVVVGKSGDSHGAASMSTVSVSPKGSKPGAVMVDTVGESGTIEKIDAPKHKVTIAAPDGKKKTIKVSKNVDLAQLTVGETVDAVLTESLIVDVEK
jgi:hypothetical protein